MQAIWKLQDAKAQFSKVVENALKIGPQYVTRRGAKAVVVLSAKKYIQIVRYLNPGVYKCKRPLYYLFFF